MQHLLRKLSGQKPKLSNNEKWQKLEQSMQIALMKNPSDEEYIQLVKQAVNKELKKSEVTALFAHEYFFNNKAQLKELWDTGNIESVRKILNKVTKKSLITEISLIEQVC